MPAIDAYKHATLNFCFNLIFKVALAINSGKNCCTIFSFSKQSIIFLFFTKFNLYRPTWTCLFWLDQHIQIKITSWTAMDVVQKAVLAPSKKQRSHFVKLKLNVLQENKKNHGNSIY